MKPLYLILFVSLGCSPAPPSVKCSEEGRRGLMVFGWIDPAQAQSLERIKAACLKLDDAGTPAAKVILWTDKARIPYENWPMTDEQVDAVVANYSRNDNSRVRFVDVHGQRHEF